MNSRQPMIGFNRTVKLSWLDQTVDLFLASQSESEIAQILSDRLSDQLSVGSNAKRGSREKTITLLLKTWVRVPAHLHALRDEALLLLQHIHTTERLPFHWGMTMAAYPFWRTVADVTGRLFRLQGTASAQQVQRRMKELQGERETVARSARYVLRAFADWGVVSDSRRSGTYEPTNPIHVEELPIAIWLLEATLWASPTEATDFRGLVRSPALFPFHLPHVSSGLIAKAGRFDVVRHGIQDELITLRQPILERSHTRRRGG